MGVSGLAFEDSASRPVLVESWGAETCVSYLWPSLSMTVRYVPYSHNCTISCTVSALVCCEPQPLPLFVIALIVLSISAPSVVDQRPSAYLVPTSVDSPPIQYMSALFIHHTQAEHGHAPCGSCARQIFAATLRRIVPGRSSIHCPSLLLHECLLQQGCEE